MQNFSFTSFSEFWGKCAGPKRLSNYVYDTSQLKVSQLVSFFFEEEEEEPLKTKNINLYFYFL